MGMMSAWRVMKCISGWIRGSNTWPSGSFRSGDALATGDVDGDGRVDVFATQMLKGDGARNSLWRNISSGPGDVRFERVAIPELQSNTLRYDRAGLVLGATFVDFDGDDDLDLWAMVAFGHQRNFEKPTTRNWKASICRCDRERWFEKQHAVDGGSMGRF